MNSIGVQPADVVIEPDVAGFGLSEFSLIAGPDAPGNV
jgi:hypothetical protein